MFCIVSTAVCLLIALIKTIIIINLHERNAKCKLNSEQIIFTNICPSLACMADC